MELFQMNRDSKLSHPLNPMDSRQGRWFLILSLLLFAIALGHYLWAVSVGWGNTISEHHDFRQTQCAITTYYMVKEPFKLAYETPVMGLPWSIPMEFPIYQWVTASIVRLFSTPLEQTGRFVGICFYLLTLVPAYFLLGSLNVAPRHRWIALSVLLVSPFYTYWSRTFMMETTALFLGVSYLACSIQTLSRPSRRVTALAVACGVLVALAKATTFPAFGAAIALYGLREYLKWPLQWPGTQVAVRQGMRLALLLGIPLLAALAWTHFADSVKLQNPLGYTISSSVLTAWNYGTLDQKLSLDTWIEIAGRVCTLFSTDGVFWTLCLLSLGLVLPLTRCRWKEILACTLLFALAPVIFTNLHFVHDYYMCANGIFLLAAAAFLVIGILETPGWQNAGLSAIAILIAMGSYGHQATYLGLQRLNATGFIPLAQKIRETTTPDAINIFLGFNISPMLPYYSERRALMIPKSPVLTEEAVRKALLALRGQKIGYVLITADPKSQIQPQRFLEDLKEIGLKPQGIIPIEMR